MNPETLKAMKEVAANARIANALSVARFRQHCNPANVSALIADYERLKRESERLRRRGTRTGT